VRSRVIATHGRYSVSLDAGIPTMMDIFDYHLLSDNLVVSNITFRHFYPANYVLFFFSHTHKQVKNDSSAKNTITPKTRSICRIHQFTTNSGTPTLSPCIVQHIRRDIFLRGDQQKTKPAWERSWSKTQDPRRRPRGLAETKAVKEKALLLMLLLHSVYF
jgi:hypothetical protein